jgi:hypothetical protein
VGFHQAGISDDIGSDDRGESAFDGFLVHVEPATAA